MNPPRISEEALCKGVQGVAEELPEFLPAHEAYVQECSAQGFHQVIIGGGLSGLLMALSLSRSAGAGQGGGTFRILVLESKDSLGGRLVFADTEATSGDPKPLSPTPSVQMGDSAERAGAQVQKWAPVDWAPLPSHWLAAEGDFEWRSSHKGAGFPMEVLGDGARGFLGEMGNHLTEAEQKFLTSGCKSTLSGASETRQLPSIRRSYVVKKELIPAKAFLSGPTEVLTRKGSQNLLQLLQLPEEELEGRGSLGEQPFWKAMKKAERDELKPFFETCAGAGYEQALVSELQDGLGFLLEQEQLGGHAVADHGLYQIPFREICERLCWILRSRGVCVLLNTVVHRVQRKSLAGAGEITELGGDLRGDGSGYEVQSLAQAESFRRIFARGLILAVPLAEALAFFPRELLSASESRLTMTVRPRSLVALELRQPESHEHFRSFEFFRHYAEFIFPTERCLGLSTRDGRFLIYAWLDYETSLQAPGVREVLGRIKRAFARILPDVSLSMFTKGSEIPRNSLGERLVLVPVGRGVHLARADLPSQMLAHTKENLWIVGEHYRMGAQAWQSVMESVSVVTADIVNRELSGEWPIAANQPGEKQNELLE